jgi:hypothetical protein
VLQEHQIDTVLFMGVHANMCILNRSFGVRQLSKWGLRCVLVRDLTDAMYNPASRPFVSHAASTELVIEHIEKYWAAHNNQWRFDYRAAGRGPSRFSSKGRNKLQDLATPVGLTRQMLLCAGERKFPISHAKQTVTGRIQK